MKKSAGLKRRIEVKLLRMGVGVKLTIILYLFVCFLSPQ